MKLIGGPGNGADAGVVQSFSIPINPQPRAKDESVVEVDYWPSFDGKYAFYHRSMRDRYERSLKWRYWKTFHGSGAIFPRP